MPSEEPIALNCPRCGRPMPAQPAREPAKLFDYIYVCPTHGRFFIAAEDGRLYDVPRTAS